MIINFTILCQRGMSTYNNIEAVHKVVNFMRFQLKHPEYVVLVLHPIQETPLKRTCKYFGVFRVIPTGFRCFGWKISFRPLYFFICNFKDLRLMLLSSSVFRFFFSLSLSLSFLE